MGGSINMLQQLQPPQYQDQTFNNDQIMQYAKGGYGKDMADAYKAEVLSQLRNGTFKDANGVYSQLMNNSQRQQQMAAYDQQVAEQQAAEQAAQQQSGDYGYYSG